VLTPRKGAHHLKCSDARHGSNMIGEEHPEESNRITVVVIIVVATSVPSRRGSVISRAREGGKSNLRGRSRDRKKMEKRGKVEGPRSPEGIGG